MEKSILKYIGEVSEISGYKGVYPLNRNLRLGDTGYLEKNVFMREDNLEKYGIRFQVRKGNPPNNTEWHSMDGVGIDTGIGLTVAQAPVGGRYRVSFKRKGAFYVRLGNHVVTEIEDITSLGSDIINRFMNDSWEKWRVVVTEIIHCEGVVVLISGSENASADLSVTSDLVPAIVEARGEVRLEGITGTFAVKIVGENATPFIRTRGICKPLIGRRRFKSPALATIGKDDTGPEEPLRFGIVEHAEQLLQPKSA